MGQESPTRGMGSCARAPVASSRAVQQMVLIMKTAPTGLQLKVWDALGYQTLALLVYAQTVANFWAQATLSA